jgi:plastocyanin
MRRGGSRTCGVCGRVSSATNSFCPGCGTMFPIGDAGEPTQPLPLQGSDGGAAATAITGPRLKDLYGVLALVVVGGIVVTLWTLTVRNDIPAFPNVLDFKIVLATVVFVLAIGQVLSASIFYGWLKVPVPSAEAAAFFHRWSGRILIPCAVLVTIYCVKDIGPQSSPTRVAIHTLLGSAVFVVLAAKLIILRAIPRLGFLVPPLGLTVAALFIGLWLTSAFFVLRTRAEGYSSADVGAAVSIVTDDRTIGRFEPQTVRVRVGQAVVWRNVSDSPHTVTREGGGFDSGAIAEGGSFRWPAKNAGTVTYRCTIHPRMPAATIIVEDK